MVICARHTSLDANRSSQRKLTGSGNQERRGMESEPKSLSQLFSGYEIKDTKKTERGDLLIFFSEKMKRKIAYVAYRVSHLTIEDLYYLKSDCVQAEVRGVPFGAAFNQALKVPKK